MALHAAASQVPATATAAAAVAPGSTTIAFRGRSYSVANVSAPIWTRRFDSWAIGIDHDSFVYSEPPAGMPPDGTVIVYVWKSPFSPPTLLPVCPVATFVMPQPFCSFSSPVSLVPVSNVIFAPAGIAVGRPVRERHLGVDRVVVVAERELAVRDLQVDRLASASRSFAFAAPYGCECREGRCMRFTSVEPIVYWPFAES